MADVEMITNVGLGVIATALKGVSYLEPYYIGWGTGTTAPVATDTTLETAAAEARTLGSTSIVTTNVASDTYRITGLITCTGAEKDITEVGFFTAATAGSLFARITFTAVTVAVGDSIMFTLNVVNTFPTA